MNESTCPNQDVVDFHRGASNVWLLFETEVQSAVVKLFLTKTEVLREISVNSENVIVRISYICFGSVMKKHES